jgi:hypothetical protein
MVMQTGYFDDSGFRQTLLPQSQADFMWPKRHCSRQEAPPVHPDERTRVIGHSDFALGSVHSVMLRTRTGAARASDRTDGLAGFNTWNRHRATR